MPPPARLDDCLAKLESPPLSYRAIAKKEVVVREYCQSLPPGGKLSWNRLFGTDSMTEEECG